jgi:polysaccharide pyruvyl transferase WcaK-like protein
MLTIFHIGPKGFNIGNDAIRVGMNALLNEVFGEHVNVISIPATAQFEAHGRAGLTSGVIHEINQYGDGVIVGGGNLLENGQLTVDLNALRALTVPMMLFSLSWGRIFDQAGNLVRRTDAMPDQTIATLHAAATISVVRDGATLGHLESLGIEGAILGGCPTLFLGDVSSRFPELAAVNRGHTLVSIRSPHLMNVPLRVQQRVARDINDIIALLRGVGHEPLLLCHDHRDLPFAASFEGIEYIYIQDVFEYLALLRSAKLNVTYRLHSALPCVELGTPFVKISYDERSMSLIDTIGLSDWNVDLMAVGSVVDEVASRLKSLDQLTALVADTRPTRDNLRDTMRNAAEKFKGSISR